MLGDAMVLIAVIRQSVWEQVQHGRPEALGCMQEVACKA